MEEGGGGGGEMGGGGWRRVGRGWGDGWRRVGREGKGIDNKNSSIHLHYFYIGVIFSNKINNLS